jgi:UDP-N-acetyl-D-mannosaminouronate:lipid I N-acetyl-D-mannosaminouronosyltransferase
VIEKKQLKNVETYAFPNRKVFLDFIKNKHKILIAVNAEKIMKDDPKLKKIINENIGYPDGAGAVMALKQKGLNAIKIAGAEFWLEIVKRFEHEKRFYIMGASTEVIDKTVKKLKEEYPSIKIVGHRNGFLKEGEKEVLVETLKINKPDIVFIAQGSPRQEFLMDELIKEHPALYMGLGGSFDVYTNFKKRAPKFFIDFNLEWLYRLIKEPTRVGRQLVLGKFLLLLWLNKL